MIFGLFVLLLCRFGQGASSVDLFELATTATPCALPMEHVYEANVTVAPLLDLGASKYGHRRIVPITGGVFSGPHNFHGQAALL
jgi:hypothetical protein